MSCFDQLRARMEIDPVEKICFQNLLITRCQMEFERNSLKNDIGVRQKDRTNNSSVCM